MAIRTISIGKGGATAELTNCPHCGLNTGYFRKTKVSGMTETNYSFDGTSAENGDLHSTVVYTDQKTLYCQECRKPIGTAK